MATKVFVSYKYADDNVAYLPASFFFLYTYSHITARLYVDEFKQRAENEGCIIYKGEAADNDLSYFSEETIWSRLKDKIYDSTVTVVLISPNMRELHQSERAQWIPWEIAFSLRETTRKDRTSRSNALIFVILPDRNNDYRYFTSMNHFSIIAENIRNNYAEVVYWSDFIANIQGYIEKALLRKQKFLPSKAI